MIFIEKYVPGFIALAVLAIWLLVRFFRRSRIHRLTHDHIQFISSSGVYYFFDNLNSRLSGTSYRFDPTEYTFFEFIFSEYRSHMERTYLNSTEFDRKLARLSDTEYFMFTFFQFLERYYARPYWDSYQTMSVSFHPSEHTSVCSFTDFGKFLCKCMFSASTSGVSSGLLRSDVPEIFSEYIDTGEITLIR